MAKKRIGAEGSTHTRAKYLDGTTLIRDINTDTAALADIGFISETTYDALLSEQYNNTTGLVILGPSAIGIEFSIGGRGADNATVNFAVDIIQEGVNRTSGPELSVTGYESLLALTGQALLSGLTFGTDGAATLGGNVATSDRKADTITLDAAFTGQYGYKLFSPGTTTADVATARLMVLTPGAIAVRVRTDVGTATHGCVWGRRVFPMFS